MDIGAYLDRIGWSGPIAHDVATLEALQRAHLTAVPFENLDVYAGVPVRTDAEWSLRKVVDGHRGGWCFEANGAFSALLEALGFDTRRLGASVLLAGPNDEVDHLAIEVTLDEPYLVDVGFGDSFIRPLVLDQSGPQDGGTGTFELVVDGGQTTLVHLTADGPVPQYRFRRASRRLESFQPASDRLASDPDRHWRQKRFATRLLDGGPDRVTLLEDRLKVTRDGETVVTPVAAPDWEAVLREWFGMAMPKQVPP